MGHKSAAPRCAYRNSPRASAHREKRQFSPPSLSFVSYTRNAQDDEDGVAEEDLSDEEGVMDLEMVRVSYTCKREQTCVCPKISSNFHTSVSCLLVHMYKLVRAMRRRTLTTILMRILRQEAT